MVKRAALLTAWLVLGSGCVVSTGPYWYSNAYVVRYHPVRPAVVTVGTFYEVLSPYGEWLLLPGYGRVWRPHEAIVGADFRPYDSAGHWMYTEAGWSFESDFSWGWAPFHYGRWMLDAELGWVWVPGVVWAPAWVTWRSVNGYVGWAPLPPVGVGYAVEAPGPAWCYVEYRHFGTPLANRYYLRGERFASAGYPVARGYHSATAAAPPAPQHRAYGPPAHWAAPPPRAGHSGVGGSGRPPGHR